LVFIDVIGNGHCGVLNWAGAKSVLARSVPFAANSSV
jgi:hypothetical protein